LGLNLFDVSILVAKLQDFIKMQKAFGLKIIWTSILLMSSSALFAASDKIRYQIDINNPAHHMADITMLMPNISEGKVDLMLPKWRTGKYTILPLANGIQNLQAKDSHGNQLEVEQLSTNHWQIQLNQDAKVEVSYQLYANDLGNRTRHIDSTHAYLDLVSVLLYSPKFRNTPVTVNLDVPRGWQSVSGMKSLPGEHSFSADNYDVIADSPIETGIHELYQYSLGNTQFKLVIWGKGNFSGLKMAQDLAKLAKTVKQYWGEFPFKDYLFIVHATNDVKGATEHVNSTVIQRKRWSFDAKKGYLNFLNTASHELIHSWNVKSYRPAGLVPYDYQNENYSRLLWFAEGGTNYLDTMLLLRSGLVDNDFYLEKLASVIDKYLKRPGRKQTSAADSSFNQWVSSRGDWANNSSVNIYSKGEVLSLWFDLLILQQSKGEQSIQSIHQALFQQFPAVIKGFTERDIIRLLQEAGISNAEKLWLDYVDGTKELPIHELLEMVGLKLNYNADDGPVQKVYAGFSLDKDSNKISQVTKDSPAWTAGLTIDDELVAINGIRVSDSSFKALFEMYKPNQKISVSFFRNDELMRVPVKLIAQASGDPRLEPLPEVTDEQKQLYQNWLGVEFPESNNKVAITKK
jgi:predicted metalloprotease with PDZ domain